LGILSQAGRLCGVITEVTSGDDLARMLRMSE